MNPINTFAFNRSGSQVPSFPASQLLNPLTYPNWDQILVQTRGSSFFHTSGWAKVLCESYNYTPLYFAEIIGNRFKTLIPVMEVRSILTGKRGVSLPFTDYCPIVVDDIHHSAENLNDLVKYGKNVGWRYIEFRSSNLTGNEKPSSSHYTHTLDLLFDEEEIFKRFRDSTKRNIKKAIKSGVEINISHSLDAVRSFYRLNCMTRKDHGLPPQPYRFFKKIHEHIISKEKGSVVLAAYNGKKIAGAVYFSFGDQAIYKYGASDRKFQNLRANNLVMWDAIKWFAQNHFKTLDFGRTEPENKGLLQFKRGWGTKEEIVYYYKYDLKLDNFIEDDSRFKTSYALLKKLPIPLLNLAGKILYKHMG